MSDFHERRRTGIGGSDAPEVLGISPWGTPYGLYLKKTGQIDESQRPPTEPQVWGTLVEPVIRDEYVRRTGRQILLVPEMLRHPSYHWMIAHLDGRTISGPEERILEIKTSRDGRGWGDPGSDEIPLHYLVQVHHYLIVSGARIADLAVLIGGSDFRIYEVRADDAIAGQLVEREAEFWSQVERREPPDPINLDDARSRWGKLLIDGAVTADQCELEAIESLRRFREQRKLIDEAEEQARLVIMGAMRDRGDSLVDGAGELLATWKMDRGRKGFTVEAREPSRRFLLKG